MTTEIQWKNLKFAEKNLFLNYTFTSFRFSTFYIGSNHIQSQLDVLMRTKRNFTYTCHLRVLKVPMRTISMELKSNRFHFEILPNSANIDTHKFILFYITFGIQSPVNKICIE